MTKMKSYRFGSETLEMLEEMLEANLFADITETEIVKTAIEYYYWQRIGFTAKDVLKKRFEERHQQPAG